MKCYLIFYHFSVFYLILIDKLLTFDWSIISVFRIEILIKFFIYLTRVADSQWIRAALFKSLP